MTLRQKDGNADKRESEAPVAMSILAATTLTWLVVALQSMAVDAGGFFARFCFVPATIPGPTITVPQPTDELAEDELRAQLRKLLTWGSSNPNGTMLKLTIEAEAALDTFSSAHALEVARLEDGGLIDGFVRRTVVNSLRFAMLYELSAAIGADVEPRSISGQSMTYGIALASHIEAAALRLISREFAVTADGKDVVRVRGVLAQGPLAQTDLQRKLGNDWSAARMERALVRLQELGEVDSERVQTTGRPRTVWTLTEALRDVRKGSEGRVR